MLLAAAVLPETALLVPGAAGRAEVLGDVRDAALAAVSAGPPAPPAPRALAAVSAVLRARPERVVVVAPGPEPRELPGPVRAGLGAAGVPDAALGRPLPGAPGAAMAGVGASVGLILLDRVGASVPVSVVE